MTNPWIWRIPACDWCQFRIVPMYLRTRRGVCTPPVAVVDWDWMIPHNSQHRGDGAVPGYQRPFPFGHAPRVGGPAVGRVGIAFADGLGVAVGKGFVRRTREQQLALVGGEVGKRAGALGQLLGYFPASPSRSAAVRSERSTLRPASFASSHRLKERWLSLDGRPAMSPSTLRSSSKSGQRIP